MVIARIAVFAALALASAVLAFAADESVPAPEPVVAADAPAKDSLVYGRMVVDPDTRKPTKREHIAFEDLPEAWRKKISYVTRKSPGLANVVEVLWVNERRAFIGYDKDGASVKNFGGRLPVLREETAVAAETPARKTAPGTAPMMVRIYPIEYYPTSNGQLERRQLAGTERSTAAPANRR